MGHIYCIEEKENLNCCEHGVSSKVRHLVPNTTDTQNESMLLRESKRGTTI